MRKLIMIPLFAVLSCVPGLGDGCQRQMTKKIVERTLETSAAKEGGKVDLDFSEAPREVRDLLPPDYEVKISAKDEKGGGYFVAGIAKNTTQQKLEEYYTKRLGQPDLRSTVGNQLLLHWDKAGVGVAINGKSGNLEVIVTVGEGKGEP